MFVLLLLNDILIHKQNFPLIEFQEVLLAMRLA